MYPVCDTELGLQTVSADWTAAMFALEEVPEYVAAPPAVAATAIAAMAPRVAVVVAAAPAAVAAATVVAKIASQKHGQQKISL